MKITFIKGILMFISKKKWQKLSVIICFQKVLLNKLCTFPIVCCVFVLFVLCTYTMLPVSLDCPFLIVPSVFSNVYLSCVHYVASFSGLSIFDCPCLIVLSVFSNVYLSYVHYVASFSGLSIFDCPFGIL